ncbi:MAG TPA: TolC family protein [Polyangiales bacterium]|nr:TolC family protein [Polyangiales bacterium]
MFRLLSSAITLGLLCLFTSNARAQEPAARTLQTWAEARQLMAAHQPVLRQQYAQLLRARAGAELALSRLLPRVDVGIGAEYAPLRPFQVQEGTKPAWRHAIFDSAVVPSANATFSITFSLADLALLDSAESGIDAEQYASAAARHQLITGLAGSILTVVGAERVAARNVAGLEAARQRMRLTERLVALGRATALDRLRFEQDLGEAESGVVNANEALSQARQALGDALGLPEAVGVSDAFDVAQLLSPQQSGCRPLARLGDRPDRLAADQRAAQASQAGRAASLAYLPSLRIGTQYNASVGAPATIVTESPRSVLQTWVASANLVWTVAEGGARRAGTSQAEADSLAAQAGQDTANLATTGEYRTAVRLVSVAQANLDIAQRTLEAARTMDQLSHKALELGKASALEVVDAARRLRAVEITAVAREVELLSARVRAQLTLAVCS